MLELLFSAGTGTVRWTPAVLGQLLSACARRRLYGSGKSAHAAILRREEWWSSLFLRNHLVNLYAKWGRMSCAQKLFDEMPVRNTVAWTALISGYGQCGRSDKAVELFARMISQGATCYPTEYTYASVVSVCAEQGRLRQGMQVHCHSLQRGFLGYTMVCNAVLSLYMAHGLVTEAKLTFEQIGCPDEVSWNSLVSGFSQNELLENAIHAFGRMREVGVPVTSFSLSSAVSACAVDKGCGRLFHGLAVKMGLDLDCFIGCALLRMYSRCKEMGDALKVFKALEYKDVASWNALIEGYIGSGFEETGLRIFCEFMKWGLNADEITITTVLGLCTSLVMLVIGKQIHCMCMKTGLEREVRVENSIINMYAKCGSLDDGMEIFVGMRDRNVVSWTSMIGALAHHGKVNNVIELFEEMKSEGIKPNKVTYACVLSACRHGGYHDYGKSVFKSMEIEAEEEHYLCMVHLLAEGGRFDEADEFIRSSPERYEESLWQTLLVCCKNLNELDRGLMISEKIMAAGLPHLPSMLVLLSQVFAAVGRWNEVERLRRVLDEQGLKKEPGCSWVDVDNEVKVFGIEKQVAFI